MKVKRSISKQLSYSHIDLLIDCLIQSVHKLSHQHTVIVVVIVFIHVMKDLVASSDMQSYSGHETCQKMQKVVARASV